MSLLDRFPPPPAAMSYAQKRRLVAQFREARRLRRAVFGRARCALRWYSPAEMQALLAALGLPRDE